MSRPGFLALAFVAGLAAVADAQPVTRTDLKPGLVFTTTDAAGMADVTPVTRLEPGVALTLAPGEAAHPRSNGGEAFSWQGYLNVISPGKYKFDAVLLGKLSVKVGDKVVFVGEVAGDDPKAARLIEGAELALPAGIQPFRVDLARTGRAVRAELIWDGPQFRPEPVPYFFFGHRPKDRPAGFAADLARDHGRLLFEELSCGRCHEPDAANDAVANTLVDRAGPNLSEIGKRAYPGWIDAWLADPQKFRPHTVMPKLFADDAIGAVERYAVTAYLASLGGPATETKGVGTHDMTKSVAAGQKLYVTAGCAACHGDKVDAAPTAKKATGDEDEDEKPTAKPEDSVYAAGTAGPGTYYRLGAVGSKFPADSLAKYLGNPLATNPHGRMPNMALTGDEARDLARFLVQATDPMLSKELPKAPDQKSPAQWRARGKELLTAKGCVNCHAVEVRGKPLSPAAAPGRTAVAKAPTSGCLAETPAVGKVPGYALTADQRKALAAFVSADLVAGPGSKAPAFQARLAVKRYGCLNCHNRDGEGGISETLANQMKALEKAENADDVQPPRLTGAGHKLRTPWLKQVLTGAGRARPWMGLRMPQYGEANVGFLPDALPKLEGTVPDDAVGKVALAPAKLDAGRALVGKTANGFGCISCHDIAGVTAGGTRGPDLATINQRLRLDWYGRWMHQPQRMAPGTRMPQNFLDGKSQVTALLKGDADAQIDAIWAYLSLGPTLPLPAGIEPPNKALVVAVKDRPEVLRTFMPDGAGSKAIAVGYPGGVNLVFDAASCRLGYAWAGNFLDAAPVWNKRGGAPANLLGPKFWEAPAGHPWAVTDSRTPPDFAARADSPAYGHPLANDQFYGGPRYVHFAGYTLDAKGNPSFRYTLDDADGKPGLGVVETPSPLPVTVASGLTRTFAVDVKPNKTAWLHAATATKEPRVDGPRVVAPQDGNRATVLELAAGPAGAEWQVVPQAGGGYAVLLRLPESAAGTKADLTLHVWGLPQDDEQLLKGLKK